MGDCVKILACFKTCRDIEHITPPELYALRDGELNLSLFKTVIGSYDEAALENARLLAESARQHGHHCALHAATVGLCDESFAQELYAVGFDKVMRIALPQGAESGVQELTAALLASMVANEGGYDAVFTGKHAWPDESGLVPHLLAQRLSLPCLTQVMELSFEARGIRAISGFGGGHFARTITKPAVYVMGEARYAHLKIATLREKMASNGKKFLGISLPPCGTHMDLGQPLRLLYTNRERQCRFIEGSTTEQRARALWEEVFAHEPT